MFGIAFTSKQKAFLDGAGSIFSLTGSPLSSFSYGDQSTDAKALQSDWDAVGSDIQNAMSYMSEEIENNNTEKDAAR